MLVRIGGLVGALHCDHPNGLKALPRHILYLFEEIVEAIDEVDSQDLERYTKLKGVGLNWSIDLLKTKNGWYLTDCALAEDSYHGKGCKNASASRKD